MINDPFYDEDTVNLGYLNRALGKTNEEIDSRASKNYSVQPDPPYYIGDTWTQGANGEIKRCIKTRLIGHYTDSDWEKACKYTDDTKANQAFDLAEALQGQVDKKIETWYQEANPATSWVTNEEKAKHKGDLWYKISTKESFMYEEVNNNYIWALRDVPQSLYDTLDSKKTIFTSIPSSYEVGDAWIIESGTSSANIPSGCQVGQMVFSSAKSSSFNVNHWSKKDTYTTLNTVIGTAQSEATNLINAFNTGHWIKYNGNSYLCDTEDINTAQNIWAFTLGGIGHSNTGINGPYSTAITMNGEINASMILVGEMLADRIKGGTLSLGGSNDTNGLFQLFNSSNKKIIQMDKNGIHLYNGATLTGTLIGESGVMNVLQADSGEWQKIGYTYELGYVDIQKATVGVGIYIPSNFTVIKAWITVHHAPRYIRNIPYGSNYSNSWCYARNLKLYKLAFNNFYQMALYGSDVINNNPYLEYTLVSGALNFSGTAPSNAPSASTSNTVKTVESADITNQLTVGAMNYFGIRTSDADISPTASNYEYEATTKTGLGRATITVIGYKK